MEKDRRKQALTILSYWKLIELLEQNEIERESAENRKLVERIKRSRGKEIKFREKKVEVFHSLNTPFFEMENLLYKDDQVFNPFPVIGDNFNICVGELRRSKVIDYLSRYTPDTDPDSNYTDAAKIAWFAFKVDQDGQYIANSFRLSPILWAIDSWKKNGAGVQTGFRLSTIDYEKDNAKINELLLDKTVHQFFAKLYKFVFDKYLSVDFAEEMKNPIGFIEYNRYASEADKAKDESPNDYTGFGRSYFLKDIQLLESLIKTESFGMRMGYERKVIDYILAGYEKDSGISNVKRINISPSSNKEDMKEFFEKVLNVCWAPKGKWPSKFMPALMQQVAINIMVNNEEPVSIFSVNGPPGTGKTTLLKEIVANNIVERAKLIADNGDDPDTLFEKKPSALSKKYNEYAPTIYAIKNDKVNDYGILVASNNNAAVENISIDLPKRQDIYDALSYEGEKDHHIAFRLKGIQRYFDFNTIGNEEVVTNRFGRTEKQKEIFFTRYANRLLKNDCWGLISAPLGKKSNIKAYSEHVLTPYLNDYQHSAARNSHSDAFKKTRKKFLEQYKLVTSLRYELVTEPRLPKSVQKELLRFNKEELDDNLNKINAEIRMLEWDMTSIQNEISELENMHVFTKVRNMLDGKNTKQLIEEKYECVSELKRQIEESKLKVKIINEVLRYKTQMTEKNRVENQAVKMNEIFLSDYFSEEDERSTKAQIANPWFTARYNRERERLFIYACQLHKEFVASSKCLQQNMSNLQIAWGLAGEKYERMSAGDKKSCMPYLIQSLFLLTPVISTTFASVQTFLGDIEESGCLGTLIIDEAGQAPPQMAIGSLFRCRKAIIVGDPKQIEPVVTAEADMIRNLMRDPLLDRYKDKAISVQEFADYINPYGSILSDGETKEWVGCPLVVHRRCIEPMYSISNQLSYGGTMKQQTSKPKQATAETFILDQSCWINVAGKEDSGRKNHFVRAQGEVVLGLLETKFLKTAEGLPKLFIITPFQSVKNGMTKMIEQSELARNDPRVTAWCEKHIGTVHTFQGQGTDEVIFLLGCDNNAKPAVEWVNKNIVNVAATRAKYRIYIVGDKDVWNFNPSVTEARTIMNNDADAKEILEGLGKSKPEKTDNVIRL